MTATLLNLFITCGQGLEQLLVDELASFGYENARLGYRGAYVIVPDIKAIYKINYCSRIGGRVLLPLIRFKCFDGDALYRNALKIDWLQYIPEGTTFAIDANVNHRKLKNSLFAAQVLKDAICDQYREKKGHRPNVDVKDPDIQLNLFIQEEWATISFDTSGIPLHKRGYRQESVEAPIQESLGAALLRLANYQETDILCDPCCGSGTLLIEAALMVTKTPPGFLRTEWGFMYLPEYSQREWMAVKEEADQQKLPLKKGMIFGADINKNAVRTTKVNLRAAGFHQEIEVTASDFRDYVPPVPPTLILTNPPHGRRLDDVDSLRSLYRDLGVFIKEKAARPGRGFVFTSSMELTKEVGLAAKRRYVLESSGIDSRLLEFDLY